MSRLSLAIFAAAFSCAVITPALADHAAIGGPENGSGAIHTMSAGTLPKGKFSVGATSEYIQSDEFNDQELVDFASGHVHAHSSDFNLVTTATGAYGITDDLMVSLSLPYVTRENIRAGNHSHSGGITTNTAVDHGDAGGIGDVTLMGKYRFLTQNETMPLSAALMLGLKMPTGENHKEHDGERLEAEHQPGSGSWDPALGIALTKNWNSYSFDASLAYSIATRGSQRTDLGDRAQYGIAVSKRFGGEMHDHGGGVMHEHRSLDLVLELNGEWSDKKEQGNINDDDSGGSEMFLSPGVRYTSNSAWSSHFSVGLPIKHNQRQGHPDTDFKVTLGIAKAF